MSFRRNKRGGSHCPTCGVFLYPGYRYLRQNNSAALPEDVLNHRCDPEFLERSRRMHDAMLSHDPEEDEPRSRTMEQRLAEGFAMLGEDDPADDDD